MKTIIVTGGMGFVGVNFIKYWQQTQPDWRIVSVDLMTYAANKAYAGPYFSTHGIHSEREDICDFHAMNSIIWEYKADVIVNFAAESHVDRSIDYPQRTLDTNFGGVQNLLTICQRYATHKPNLRFMQMSTDEVFGDAIERLQGFKEYAAYCPSSPYAASKAAADCLVKAYRRTYGLDCRIIHATNMYGEFQQSEKFIPKIVSHILAMQKVPLYGKLPSLRYWLHVNDFCAGLSKFILTPVQNQRVAYNFSGDTRVLDRDLAKHVIQYMIDLTDQREVTDEYLDSLLEIGEARPGQDRAYWLDDSAARKELEWQPKIPLDVGLLETVRWFLANRDRLKIQQVYSPLWRKHE